MDQDRKDVVSEERRNFLKLTGAGGFTAAVMAGAAGTLWSSEAAAQTAAEEREREAAADHVMTIATAYVLGASRSYPILQLDLKENIQNATNGKIYVKLAPGGQLGAGGALAQKTISGEDDLKGSVMNPPAHAKKAIPKACEQKLELLLNDEDVSGALCK